MFGSSLSVLESALGASALRHKVLSNNIANVNTPEFKRSDVDFNQILSKEQSKLQVTHKNHITAPSAKVSAFLVTDNTSMRPDGNNVDIDKEMANLAENTIYYNAVAQQTSWYFGMLKNAINEGRK